MIRIITNERAYVLGLLVGAGTIANSTFSITVPLDKWGASPNISNGVAVDILTKIRKLFSDAYGVEITYELGNKGKWSIKPIEKFNCVEIIDDLNSLSLPFSGVLLSNETDLTGVRKHLKGMKAEHFLSGVFDAKCSIADSQRRFSNASPIVSLEIPGKTSNFIFAVQICSWLTELGTVTDQILYNHPCQHCGSDPTYSGWKKGFKIRFLAQSFIKNNSFVMNTKALGATSLANTQKSKEQIPCVKRKITLNTVAIHQDIGSAELPAIVQNKLFFHYLHFCAVLGCPNAPIEHIKSKLTNVFDYISIFPLLSKGGFGEMRSKYKGLVNDNFSSEKIIKTKMSCSAILSSFNQYPEVSIALAYLLSNDLFGKRHKGSKEAIIKANLKSHLTVCRLDTDTLPPIFIGNLALNRGVIVSCLTGEANTKLLKKIIEIDGLNVKVKSNA